MSVRPTYSLPVVGWRLYYSDGSTFTSADGSWADAPASDVQILVVFHGDGYRTFSHGDDFYFMPGKGAVKVGAWMDFDEYEALVARALSEEE
jgi:hypothetical protein